MQKTPKISFNIMSYGIMVALLVFSCAHVARTKWGNDAKEGNKILLAIYHFQQDSGNFPQTLYSLFPKYLENKPDTTWINGWYYSRLDKPGGPYIFKLSKFTFGYKTRIQYFHEIDRAYWIVNSEGTRITISTEPPEMVKKFLPKGNSGVPEEYKR